MLSIPDIMGDPILNEEFDRRLCRISLEAYAERMLHFKLGEWQKILCRKLQQFTEAVERKEGPRLLIDAPAQHGKALSFGTEVPTISGMKNIEDLQPGDFVIGSDGRATKVVATRRWTNRPRYRVTTDDGHSVIVDANHEWLVRLDQKGKAWTVRTTEWLANRKSPRAPMIPMGRIYGRKKRLPVPPYTLGAWLGDGTSCCGAITGASDDMAHIAQYIKADGFDIHKNKGAFAYGVTALAKPLREAGVLNNKHIPETYFNASIEQRMALLQGLMDTDGYVSGHGMFEFCSVNERLARGVARLIHSLGRKAKVLPGRATIYGRDVGPKFRVMFYMKDCARLPRKRKFSRDAMAKPCRYLEKIERVEDGDTCCIEVAARDHLYLATDACIVTHNSSIVSRAWQAWVMGKHPEWPLILGSYAQDLAAGHGRWIRNMLGSAAHQAIFPECRLSADSTAHDLFRTTKGGQFLARGIGGGTTGQPGAIFTIDDPLADRQQADSPVTRNTVGDWYHSVATTRLAPGGGCVTMATRWHLDDLTGRMIEAEKSGGDHWDHLHFPAIAETDEGWRKIGMPLFPERYSLKELLRKRANMPTRDWLSIYQGRPVGEEGNLFKPGLIVQLDKFPNLPRNYQAWDLALTEEEVGRGDHSAGSCMGVDSAKRFCLAEVTRGRWGPEDSAKKIVSFGTKWKPGAIWIEGGMTYQAVFPWIQREMQRTGQYFDVRQVSPRKDKVAKSFTARGIVNSGNLYVPRGAGWLKDFTEEMAAFPANKASPDQIDSFSHLCAQIAAMLKNEDVGEHQNVSPAQAQSDEVKRAYQINRQKLIERDEGGQDDTSWE